MTFQQIILLGRGKKEQTPEMQSAAAMFASVAERRRAEAMKRRKR